MYFVYILRSSKDNRFYTGNTNDLSRGFINTIRVTLPTSTLNRGPFDLIFAQECISRLQARLLEKFLKSGEGRELRDILIK